MTLELTDAQQDAVRRGEPVRLTDRVLGDVIVLRASDFDEARADRQEKADLAALARKTADRWGRDNPFGDPVRSRGAAADA